MSRIDDAVRRILSVKYDLGLFDTPFADPEHAKIFGSDSHRKIARSAVQKTMVCLRMRRVYCH